MYRLRMRIPVRDPLELEDILRILGEAAGDTRIETSNGIAWENSGVLVKAYIPLDQGGGSTAVQRTPWIIVAVETPDPRRLVEEAARLQGFLKKRGRNIIISDP